MNALLQWIGRALSDGGEPSAKRLMLAIGTLTTCLVLAGVVGKSPAGALLVLGGNQGDQVCIRGFPMERVAGYRWPAPGPALLTTLPVLAGATTMTTGEA